PREARYQLGYEADRQQYKDQVRAPLSTIGIKAIDEKFHALAQEYPACATIGAIGLRAADKIGVDHGPVKKRNTEAYHQIGENQSQYAVVPGRKQVLAHPAQDAGVRCRRFDGR